MHWTILPPEVVFQPVEAAPRRMVGTYEGRRVILEAGEDGWRLGALLSTDPNDFLDPRFRPGTLLPAGALQIDTP
ncbi:MAG: hypothetical protein IMW98_09795 [Firmicutes bacterium]|nr:hypothetical protein [Bacillota bacterium]